MNITPQHTSLPMATVVNPQAETLRRENNLREVITQPAAVNPSAAEKAVAEKERAKTPGQQSEQIDFENIRKQAEEDASKIKGKQGNSQGNGDQQSGEQQARRQAAEQQLKEQELSDLKQRDREVRAHEAAHAAVGGAVAGAPSYTFERGPDGNNYAIAGEVSVDLSPVEGDPQATIEKMELVQAAALAPAEPSSQDRQVAAQASLQINEARAELATERDKQVDEAQEKSERAVSDSDEDSDEAISLAGQEDESSEFDQLIDNTLEAQEAIVPEYQLSPEAQLRADVIASRYQAITLAYGQAPRSNFQLTA